MGSTHHRHRTPPPHTEARYFDELTATAEDSDVLEPGLYSATFTGIEVPDEPGQWGEYLIWHFSVITDDGPTDITARSSRPAKYTKSTKARTGYEEILGRPVEKGDVMAFSKLAGRPCQLKLEVKSTDKGDFNRVADVIPPGVQAPRRTHAPAAHRRRPLHRRRDGSRLAMTIDELAPRGEGQGHQAWRARRSLPGARGQLAEPLGGRRPGRRVLLKCFAGCTASEIAAALGLELRDLMGEDDAVEAVYAPRERLARTRYEIRDTDGTLRAVHVRVPAPGGRKSYLWERPDGTSGLNGTPVEALPSTASTGCPTGRSSRRSS